MTRQISLLDKTFEHYIDKEEIQQSVKKIAQLLYERYSHTTPVFIGILNGSFMFISDLCKFYPGLCEIAFMRVASYEGEKSTGSVSILMDVNTPIKQRDVVLIEDIVDTGQTYQMLYRYFSERQVKSVALASLFLKPDAYNKKLIIDFVGKEIQNRFVVGYGLDYNGLGRNIPDLYQLKK